MRSSTGGYVYKTENPVNLNSIIYSPLKGKSLELEQGWGVAVKSTSQLREAQYIRVSIRDVRLHFSWFQSRIFQFRRDRCACFLERYLNMIVKFGLLSFRGCQMIADPARTWSSARMLWWTTLASIFFQMEHLRMFSEGIWHATISFRSRVWFSLWKMEWWIFCSPALAVLLRWGYRVVPSSHVGKNSTCEPNHLLVCWPLRMYYYECIWEV